MVQYVIFTLADELTFQTVVLERQRLLGVLRDKSHLMIKIDLSNVVICDSAGLALLLEVKRVCATANHVLMLSGMSSKMLALAEFCGLKTILISKESI
jgi:phospholipid transport system transporter-binding protein